MKGKVPEKSGLKRGMAFVRGFIHLETWRERFQRKVVLSGVHLFGNMEGKVQEKSGLKRGMAFVQGFIHLET